MKSIITFLNKLAFRKNLIITRPLHNHDQHYYFNQFVKLDYIRTMTLNLVANEINRKKLAGSIAEVGVYKGDFSRLLNLCFKEKDLYLFDTFEGFAEEDFVTGKEDMRYDAAKQRFKNTDARKVFDSMPAPSKCILRKGYFPETAKGLEEQRFCFVSLDADLYEPIYAGLDFFYPRLVKGGYIMIHDYNNKEYQGAKKAVQDFCDSSDISVIPIPDGWGTAIIVKN